LFYITTALYSEAKPFIEHFRLKKIHETSRFQVFANEEMTLILTGVGIFSSAIATAHVLTLFRARPDDLLINVGICGTPHDHLPIGQALLCNKIIHHETGQTFYPDILVQHDLKECTLETFSHPVRREMRSSVQGDVVDMEGYACCAAASTFLAPHQIYVVKVVSDFLDESEVTPHTVSRCIGDNIPAIERLMQAGRGLVSENKNILNEEEERLLLQIRDRLRLTATVYHQLVQLAIQYKIRTGGDLSCLYPYGSVQVQSKNEGKIALANIKRQLLYE
jgi:adenosylhomocysteine nucleosidase